MTNDLEKMNQTIKEIKEYQQMQKDLDAQLEALKDELKTMLKDNDMDEVVTDSGKAFTTTTTYKRLTVN